MPIELEAERVVDDPGCRGRGRLPHHRDRRISPCSQGSTTPVEISLRRTSELTGKLTIGERRCSAPTATRRAGVAERKQFERIIEGLARQLRSPLDRKLGRYSVDLPVFPER